MYKNIRKTISGREKKKKKLSFSKPRAKMSLKNVGLFQAPRIIYHGPITEIMHSMGLLETAFFGNFIHRAAKISLNQVACKNHLARLNGGGAFFIKVATKI